MTTDPAAPKSPLELPMAMWVRGGTTSTAHDNQQAAARADAERRRNIEDARARLVMDNPTEAHLRSLNLTDQRRDPCIVLTLHQPEDLASEQCCELTTQPLNMPYRGSPFQLILQVVCPACVYRLNRRMGEAQLQIQQINRHFDLDDRCKGELKVLRDGTPVFLAGLITTSEPITCSYLGCRFRFHIDKSIIKPV